MKILVRNLSRKMTEEQLQEMFIPFGKVQSCTIVMDKKTNISKGFGFVEMPKSGEAKAAMKTLNGKEVEGNKIRVKRAEEKSEENSELKSEDKAEGKKVKQKSVYGQKSD